MWSTAYSRGTRSMSSEKHLGQMWASTMVNTPSTCRTVAWASGGVRALQRQRTRDDDRRQRLVEDDEVPELQRRLDLDAPAQDLAEAALADAEHHALDAELEP